MASEHWRASVLLSVMGVILIRISGYLGGELVFKHGVAVNPQHDTGRINPRRRAPRDAHPTGRRLRVHIVRV